MFCFCSYMFDFDGRHARIQAEVKSKGGSDLDAAHAGIILAITALDEALHRCRNEDMRIGCIWDALAYLRRFQTKPDPFDKFWEELKFIQGNDAAKVGQYQMANAHLNGICRSVGVKRPSRTYGRRLLGLE